MERKGITGFAVGVGSVERSFTVQGRPHSGFMGGLTEPGCEVATAGPRFALESDHPHLSLLYDREQLAPEASAFPLTPDEGEGPPPNEIRAHLGRGEPAAWVQPWRVSQDGRAENR